MSLNADTLTGVAVGAALATGAACMGLIGGGGGGGHPSGFGELAGASAATVGAENILDVAATKAFIASAKPVIIDVKDSGDKDAIKNDNTVSIPLSNLVFMAGACLSCCSALLILFALPAPTLTSVRAQTPTWRCPLCPPPSRKPSPPGGSATHSSRTRARRSS